MLNILQNRSQDFYHALAVWAIGGLVLLLSASAEGLSQAVYFIMAVVLGVWGVWLMREGLKEKKAE